jgi:hypothetical protein
MEKIFVVTLDSIPLFYCNSTSDIEDYIVSNLSNGTIIKKVNFLEYHIFKLSSLYIINYERLIHTVKAYEIPNYQNTLN